jgi:hypothetical protein
MGDLPRDLDILSAIHEQTEPPTDTSIHPSSKHSRMASIAGLTGTYTAQLSVALVRAWKKAGPLSNSMT